MSLVLVVWLWVPYGCENAATKVAVPVRNARRLQAGIWRPEAESYGRLIVMNVGVVGGRALYYNAPHGDGETRIAIGSQQCGVATTELAHGGESSVLRALESIVGGPRI